MTTNNKNPVPTQRETWFRAAVMGSLWASLEIIVGSFLHNLHVPFAGTILGFFSLSLLIAFCQKWQLDGLLVRAGLIAALMRSLSPSAIIFGPMVGIFVEGLFLEYSVRFFGRNRFGYFLGAFAALSSNMLQKIVTVLIFYGFDIVVVAQNMYFYALKQLHLESLELWVLIVILLTLYAVVAALAVLLGTVAGAKAFSQSEVNHAIDFSAENKLFVSNPNQKHSTLWLFGHFVFVVLGLVGISFLPFYYSMPAIVVYVVFVNFHYPNSFRRLGKPWFWLQLLILIAFASMFFNGLSEKGFFDPQGLLVGLLMSLRAVLLITAFTAISFELRNPVVKTILYRRGFSQLYMSLGLAFGALPSLLERMMKPRVLFKLPVVQIAQLIHISEHIMKSFQAEANKNQKIIILSGNKQQGKTTFLQNVITQLEQANIEFDGVVAIGKEENGKRTGFDLLYLKTKKSYPLARITPLPNWDQFGRFYFDTDVFVKVGQSLVGSSSKIIIIDEIGPMELQGKGWADAVGSLLAANTQMIWVVRKPLLETIMNYWGISQAQVFEIGNYTPEKVAGAVMKSL